MSKEVIRPQQYAQVKDKANADGFNVQLNKEQIAELADLYQGMIEGFQTGKIIKGEIIQVDSDGVLVDINFKSHCLSSKYEFCEH